MNAPGNSDIKRGTHARFPSQTHWSLIVAAGQPASLPADDALNQLCQTYWFPIYAFIRRSGSDSHRAKDLTQSFFVHLLQKDLIKRADREKRRFRSFLCASLKNFLIDNRRGERPDKVLIPIPEEAGPAYGDLPAHEPDPTKIFDRTWAATVIKQATENLKQLYGERGRLEVYETLKRCLSGELASNRYPEFAAQLGMTKPTFEVALSRFKDEFAKSVRSVIAQTVSEPREIKDEIHYLMAAWASYLESKQGSATKLA